MPEHTTLMSLQTNIDDISATITTMIHQIVDGPATCKRLDYVGGKWKITAYAVGDNVLRIDIKA